MQTWERSFRRSMAKVARKTRPGKLMRQINRIEKRLAWREEQLAGRPAEFGRATQKLLVKREVFQGAVDGGWAGCDLPDTDNRFMQPKGRRYRNNARPSFHQFRGAH